MESVCAALRCYAARALAHEHVTDGIYTQNYITNRATLPARVSPSSVNCTSRSRSPASSKPACIERQNSRDIDDDASRIGARAGTCSPCSRAPMPLNSEAASTVSPDSQRVTVEADG